MKRLRVAVLLLEDLVPPETIEGVSDEELSQYKTEYDVCVTLSDLGHEAIPVGISGDLAPLRQAVREHKPHIVFNLLEEFHGVRSYVPYVLGYLELIRQRYTGCNAHGVILTQDKATMKTILTHHRIRVPAFAVFPRGKKMRRPSRLGFPLFVKSTTEHASLGIAHASIVHDDAQLYERVAYVHDHLETDAIAEQYIDGREFYVGVIGNQRLQVLPIWELVFANLPEGAPRIATSKVKWDLKYRKKVGVASRAADKLSEELEQRIHRICKRAYRLLGQTGYARMDLRVTDEGRVYLLESNPNPQLDYGEDFAEAAEAMGIQYEDLIQRILNLGMRHRAAWMDA